MKQECRAADHKQRPLLRNAESRALRWASVVIWMFALLSFLLAAVIWWELLRA